MTNLKYAAAVMMVVLVSMGTGIWAWGKDEQPTPLAVQRQSNLPITAEERGKAISSIAKEFDAHYVFPEVAAKVKAALESEKDKGRYASITTGQELARVVTVHLQEVTKDRHIRVQYSMKKLPGPRPDMLPDPDTGLSVEEKYEKMLELVRIENAGYTKVERLPGNIGYIRQDGFAHPHANREPLEAAMTFVKDTDALIIDLRYNKGGPSWTVRDLCSCFFPDDKPILLSTIKATRMGLTEEFWTDKEVLGPRYLDKPVFVLTSAYTSSGAEECAYNFQAQKRAAVVGEITADGPNPTSNVPAADHYLISIPTGQVINPVTKTNWIGVGVKPDVAVDADKALDTACDLAIKALQESKDERVRARVKMDVVGVARRLSNTEQRRQATLKERQTKKQ